MISSRPDTARPSCSVLATAFALEGIFDVVPEGAQTKILAGLAVLGFTLASGRVGRQGVTGQCVLHG